MHETGVKNPDVLEGTTDIFDRIMQLPVCNIFEPFYKKHKEGLLYLFFGALSFFISIATYAIFTDYLQINVLISNIFAWIFSVTFAYLTNRICVFKTNAWNIQEIFGEAVRFLSGRIFTLLAEEGVLYFFVVRMGMDKMVIKLAATILVIVLNYVVSKFWVFKQM